MAYWDTSCLLKLYLVESDSPKFRRHAAANSVIVTSEIARFELYAAARRKEALGELRAGGAKLALAAFDRDVFSGKIAIQTLSSEVFASFEEKVEQCLGAAPPIHIRTLDAIHLATALAISEREMVTADIRLKAASAYVGLSVVS
jgi:predicted nucleic acid-binding protein